jgi:predicted RNA binding protein with dsRBD fold (UPF0201 family)
LFFSEAFTFTHLSKIGPKHLEMQRVTRSNQSSGSISDDLRGYFESESFLDIMRRVVSNMVAEESFQLALKKSVDAAVASAVEPFKANLYITIYKFK